MSGWEQSLDTHGCSHEPIDQHWQRNQQYPRSVGTDINATTLMPLLVEAKQLLEALPSQGKSRHPNPRFPTEGRPCE